jgi:GNAT superfamily N-acetyltransferase
MTAQEREMRSLHLIPAMWSDLDVLADMMVQLYNAELPVSMSGPIEGQRALMRYFIEQSGPEGMRGRYVAVDDGGTIVGSAALRMHGDPDIGVLPSGSLGAAVRYLGLLNAVQLFTTMLRAAFAPETRLEPQSAYIHSVVIDAALRGQGFGRLLMAAIEQVARERNARTCVLRVISGNTAARQLYLQIGYQPIPRAQPWMEWTDWLTFPSELMIKRL